MTAKEADEAARQRLPVRSGGIDYVRITEVGYSYDEKGNRSPFVVLLDKCLHSVTHADPQRCEIIAEGKEANHEG